MSLPKSWLISDIIMLALYSLALIFFTFVLVKVNKT